MEYEKKNKDAISTIKQALRQLSTNGVPVGNIIKAIKDIEEKYAESDDERIRGNIIATIHLYYGEPLEDEAKEMIAWLEKQCEQKIKTPEESLGIDSDTYNKIVDECIYGEQKPIDKVEPNFKVGDWVIWDNKIPCHVDNIYQGKNSLMYTITDTNNMTRSYSVKGFDNNAHLWTIQDARNGDILCSNQIIVLFKQWEDNTGYTFVIAHAGIDISGKLQITNGHWLINNKSKPATKEQRDILFQKMKEACYEWDADKKELRKIEQKPAWSEEDERNLQGIIDEIEANKNHAPDYDVATYNRFLSWLKSIKERYTWKPSDEQMNTLEYYMHTLICNEHKEVLFGLYEDLKKLKEG